jgi:glycosyltransferase involved in cell wall biosynthesis
MPELPVCIDDQVFTVQPRGGISRYFTELIRAFRTVPELGVAAETPFRYVVNEYLLDLEPGRYRRPAPIPESLQRGRILRGLNRARMGPRPSRRAILHHTYYFPERLDLPAAARLCTVYDMIPEVFPELFPAGSPHQAKDRYVQECDAILSISHATKADLLAHYGTLDKPVVVTPLGVADAFFTPDGDRHDTADPYVLFVGQRGWYKNFDVVLRAFARLEAEGTGAPRLVCVGPPFDEDEQARIAELGLEQRVTRPPVADWELPVLYAGATCLVFPSRYEGFGLPIIEAFAAGCPAVLAEMACSLEVGGDAAQYFAPDDDEALAAILERLGSDTTERGAWVAAGRARARDFTWRRTAELTRDVYADLAARQR